MFFLALFLSAFAYLIVPVCYRLKTGGINSKKAKKLALINSLIVGVIFLIITATLFEDVTWSILPAVTYYYISKAILISKEEKKKEKVKELEKKYGITLTEGKEEEVQENQTVTVNMKRKTNDKIENQSISTKSKQSREEKWLAQEEIDKLILNRGDDLASQILSSISTINALWDCDTYLDKENKRSKSRAKSYLLAITPELFLDNYYLFKAGNRDDIKDSIYTKRPYLVLETLINMGLFIFETKNNIYILKEIINGDAEEYINSKVLAQRILGEEEKKTEEIMGRIKIEEDRKIFWGLMMHGLKQYGSPFDLRITYLPNGAPKHYAKIKSGNGALLGVDFLASEGVLRIQLYIDNNIALYERLHGKKEYLESVLGFALVFQDGEKNKDVKWIKKEWSFTPHNSDEYESLVQDAIPSMIKFVELFGRFI